MAERTLRSLDPDELGYEARKVLDVIAAEFKRDPQSVACFDARIVRRAIEISEEHQRREKRFDDLGLGRRPRRR